MRERARDKGRLEDIVEYSNNGIAVEKIEKYTGLTAEEIEGL